MSAVIDSLFGSQPAGLTTWAQLRLYSYFHRNGIPNNSQPSEGPLRQLQSVDNMLSACL